MPDGARIVTASQDEAARVSNTGTGALLATLSGHAGPVFRAAFGPDGSSVVTGSFDRSARIWNLEKNAPAVVLPIMRMR